MDTSFCPAVQQRQGKEIDAQKLKFKRRFRMEMDASGTSQKALAIEAKIDQGKLSLMLNDEKDEALHAHHIPAFVRECGPGFMVWLAGQCGGTYHHGEEAQQIVGTPMVLAGLLAQHSGQTLAQIIQDFQDGKWSEAECRDALPGLRVLQLVIDTLTKIAEGVAA